MCLDDRGAFTPNDRRLSGVRRVTALDAVRARIVLAAHLGLLQPGETLPGTEDLAEAFDVSPMTVRRALVALAEDGVVERRRGRGGGTRIAARPVLPRVLETADALFGYSSEVLGLIEVRAALESGLVAAAASRITDEQLEALSRLVEQMSESEDWWGFRRLDAAFHRALATAAGMPGAAELHGRTLDRLHHFFLPYDVAYLRASNREHVDIVAALRGHDVGAAATLARRHVEELRDSMFIGRAGPTGQSRRESASSPVEEG